MKTLIVVLALSGMTSLPANAQALWESGNRSLRSCDDRGLYRIGQSASANLSLQTSCLSWLVGLRQGMEIEDQLRPNTHLLPANAQKAHDQTGADYLADLAKLGIKPSVVMPSGNTCIPDDVPNDQIALVVIKYMKDHPDKLTTHAAFLALAAMKTEWECH